MMKQLIGTIRNTQTQLQPDTTITLQPVAMVFPNGRGIYAPSRIRQKKAISYQEFLSNFADHPRSILVSLAEDGVSNPKRMTAYGNGLDCWYVEV